MHVRDSVANAYGRALEAFEWICEVDTAKPVEQIRIPRATKSGSYQNLDSKLNAALQQIVSNIGGLHLYFTFYMPLCTFVRTVMKHSQEYLHALFLVFATKDAAHRISTRIPEFRRSGGGENAHEKVLTDGEEAV